MRLPARWMPRRLSSRIVALFMGLLLVVQGAGFVAVQWSVERNARALLAQDLEVGERIWARLLAQRVAKLTLSASVLAADWGFRDAAASGDVATLASALANHGARIDADLTAMLSPELAVRAVGDDTPPAAAAAVQPLARELAQRGSALALVEGQPYQVVMVPMKAPLLVGYVVMGFALDQALFDEMRAVSGLHVAMGVGLAGAAQPPQVAFCTLPPAHGTALAQHLAGTAAPTGMPVEAALVQHRAAAAASTGMPVEAALAGELYLLREPAGSGTAGLRTVLLRSLAEAVAPYRSLQGTLAGLTLLGLLLSGAASLVTARRVTTPLGALTRASGRLARGEFDTPMQDTGRSDEIGELARSFEHMRSSIGRQQQEIRQLAYWDPLTGLPNRAQLRDAARTALERATAQAEAETPAAPRPVSVVMLDLDRFKHVNDVLGYAFGDRLLKGVAARLAAEALREGDLVARLSGDEFALLLPGAAPADALAVAERVAQAFHAPLTLDDHTVDVAAGIGVASWPQHAADADTLISRAEVAMYAAKRQTTVAVVYDPGQDVGSAQTLSLLSELRRALERGELRLYVQPKIALASAQRIVGAEALVRWQHPQRGLVPPMQFIPFAEQTGFVRQLTLWMLDATAREWPALHALGLERVSVNLSTRDLLDQDLPAKLSVILRRHTMPAAALCLEITESAIMDEPARALATLNTLSAAGYKLSIDDFGTGYSSLAYLKRLPVNELKIDRSFVMAMAKDQSDAKIVRSTIDLAHNLGLSVVAEGVEDAAILDQLARLNCDEAQGYHIARPMPVGEMAAFAQRWRARHEAVVAA